ncbi:MAG: hypothetical protein ACOH5I_06435 [Oligoflexus sp.]
MVRLFLLSSLLLALSTNQAAAKQSEISAEMRFDYVQSKTDPASGEVSSESYFANIYPRVQITGALNDRTSYNIRYNFYQSEGRSADTYITTRDLTASNLEYFYINHQLADSLSFKAGKIFAFAGSQEWNYSEIDNYYYSRVANNIPLFYQTGLELGYSLGDQWFGVQFLNGAVGAAEQRENDFAKTFAYYGSFADNLINPILTYSLYPRQSVAIDNQMTSQTQDHQWGAGARINVSQFEIDLEYGNFIKEAHVEANAAGDAINQSEQEWRSVITQIRWRSKTLGLAPFVKVSIENRYDDGDHSHEYLDYALGSEFTPEDSTIRYHAVYIKRNDDAVNATNQADTTTTSQELRIGTSLTF